MWICPEYVIVPRFRESMGTLNVIHPSVCPSVTKTLTLAITFALLQIEIWYLACVFIVTRPFRWYHVVTLTVTFDLLQFQICCRAGDHNSLNVLVYFPLHLRRSEKGGGGQGDERWGDVKGERPTPCPPPHLCIRALKNLNLNYITTER